MTERPFAFIQRVVTFSPRGSGPGLSRSWNGGWDRPPRDSQTDARGRAETGIPSTTCPPASRRCRRASAAGRRSTPGSTPAATRSAATSGGRRAATAGPARMPCPASARRRTTTPTTIAAMARQADHHPAGTCRRGAGPAAGCASASSTPAAWVRAASLPPDDADPSASAVEASCHIGDAPKTATLSKAKNSLCWMRATP